MWDLSSQLQLLTASLSSTNINKKALVLLGLFYGSKDIREGDQRYRQGYWWSWDMDERDKRIYEYKIGQASILGKGEREIAAWGNSWREERG